MAVEDRSLSEFPRALNVAEQALVMISNPDGLGGYDTNGAVLTEVGKALLNVQYTQQLGNVSVFDAIKNTRVLSGTTTPLANEGANGQLYVKYQTVSDVDTVIGMYFKKDGAWLEISLGGGGGSSTLAGLSDVDITTPTGGQALIYDDVNDEWVNGDVSQVIVYPIAVTSQMVSASSTVGTNFEGYRAFDGQSCNLSTMQGGWLAGASDSTPTLTVNFGEAKKLGRISIETANNNNPDTTRDVYIEGSSDGSTWENILASGSTVSLVFEVGKYNEYSFNLNEGEYQYFRIRGTQPFFGGSYQYACSFSEITIYDTSSGIPAIADLTDVDITSPTDGQLLRYNGTSGKWENADNELNTIVQISASDFFTSDTISGVDTNEFYAYRIGKMVCVERCKLVNVSLVSPTYKIVGIKDEYLPNSNIRICGQFDGSGQLDTPYRMYLSPSYKGFGSEKWGTYSAIWVYSFTYFID